MKIISQKFIKGIVGEDALLEDGVPQIAFIGRSNSGKSTLLNSLTNSKIARASSYPGRTQEINIFLINESFYFVDLPGYGFARVSGLGREKIGELIDMYLFRLHYKQKKIVFIIDANVGFTETDLSMLDELENNHKDFIIVASKIDKMNQSEYYKQMKEIKRIAGVRLVIPISSKKNRGLKELMNEIFK